MFICRKRFVSDINKDKYICGKCQDDWVKRSPLFMRALKEWEQRQRVLFTHLYTHIIISLSSEFQTFNAQIKAGKEYCRMWSSQEGTTAVCWWSKSCCRNRSQPLAECNYIWAILDFFTLYSFSVWLTFFHFLVQLFPVSCCPAGLKSSLNSVQYLPGYSVIHLFDKCSYFFKLVPQTNFQVFSLTLSEAEHFSFFFV